MIVFVFDPEFPKTTLDENYTFFLNFCYAKIPEIEL